MQRNIIYLINPKSGTGLKSSLRETIAHETGKRNILFDIMETDETGNYASLVQRINEQQITDVVICGGDGSVNAVAAQLIGIGVNIGIIPMGSGNGLAFTSGIPRGISKALEIIFSGAPSFIDGLYINDQFSCMLCGIGFDATVAHDFAGDRKRGLQTYVKKTLLHYFSAKPYPFVITAAGASFSTEAFFISIANSNQFGNHVTIAPDASLSDGLLDIVIVKKMSKFLLPFILFRHITGTKKSQPITALTGKEPIIYFQTPSLTIVNQHHAPLHIDGEPKTSARLFEIRIVPKAIKLLQKSSLSS